MDPHSHSHQTGPATGAGYGTPSIAGPRLERLGSDARVLRTWRWTRLVGAVVAAAAAASLAVSVNGMLDSPAAPWWSAVILAAGSLLAGLVAGSYIAAPIGAEATLCDTRWLVIGLMGIVLATSTGPGTLTAHLFTGAPPVILAGIIQPVFAVLSLALLGWALRERLGLERLALSPVDDGDSAGACTSCRPLFPVRPSR